MAKIKAGSLDRYRRATAPFCAWLHARGFNPSDADEVDDLVVEFKQDSALTKSQFEQLVAGIEFIWPRYKGKLCWSRAVIAGWSTAHESRHTTPLPRSLGKLVACHLACIGHERLGVGLLVQNSTGCRPSELLGLRWEDITLPEEGDDNQGVCILGLGCEQLPRRRGHR